MEKVIVWLFVVLVMLIVGIHAALWYEERRLDRRSREGGETNDRNS